MVHIPGTRHAWDDQSDKTTLINAVAEAYTESGVFKTSKESLNHESMPRRLCARSRQADLQLFVPARLRSLWLRFQNYRLDMKLAHTRILRLANVSKHEFGEPQDTGTDN